MSAGAAIEIVGLEKTFGRGRDAVCAVAGLDLEVRRGEVFGLLGPNGAGKTTTVEICEGLVAPSTGTVRVLGCTWEDADPHALRSRIGVSLQETRFFDRLTVREILTLFRSFYPAGGRSAEDCLDLLALGEKAGARARQLSGGQRQRLAVACALVGAPELLFLDEPTTGLDPQSRRQLWAVIRAFRSEGGTALLTTHYMDEADQLCDRIAVIDHGVRIALGSPGELVATLGGDHVIELRAAGLGAELDHCGLGALPGVRGMHRDGDAIALTVEAPHISVPPLLACLTTRGVALDGLTTRHTSLEDVFVSLTGRHLREP